MHPRRARRRRGPPSCRSSGARRASSPGRRAPRGGSRSARRPRSRRACGTPPRRRWRWFSKFSRLTSSDLMRSASSQRPSASSLDGSTLVVVGAVGAGRAVERAAVRGDELEVLALADVPAALEHHVLEEVREAAAAALLVARADVVARPRSRPSARCGRRRGRRGARCRASRAARRARARAAPRRGSAGVGRSSRRRGARAFRPCPCSSSSARPRRRPRRAGPRA